MTQLLHLNAYTVCLRLVSATSMFLLPSWYSCSENSLAFQNLHLDPYFFSSLNNYNLSYLHLQNVKREHCNLEKWACKFLKSCVRKDVIYGSLFYKQYLQGSSFFQIINFQTKMENSSNICKKQYLQGSLSSTLMTGNNYEDHCP